MAPVKYHNGKFPPAKLDLSKLISLVGRANAALARFDGMMAGIPNALILVSPMTTQEAVLSSRIEGTQATMGEVLQFEAGGELDPAKRQDIEEVLNYRRALNHAAKGLGELPLCNRLIRNAHEILLSGVRGHDKARGRFRTIQNYIGKPGQPIEKARFVPIAPDRLEAGLDRWEKYVNEPIGDPLFQLAIIHAEFEALHPFLDGNGRIGRMLIPLFLFERNMLRLPTFYLSEYLEAHRKEYVDGLLAVSRDDDWTGWCLFFLEAIQKQAAENESKVGKILELYQGLKDWIVDATRSPYGIRALDWFFKQPIFKASDFIAASKIPKPTAHRILKVVQNKKLLRVQRPSRGRRPAILAFSKLLNIAEGREVF